jgi:uncharacterized protein (TIGR03790 family)
MAATSPSNRFVRVIAVRSTRRAIALVAGAVALCALAAAAHAATPRQVLVVINSASPVSVAVGRAYVAGRHIPNVVHVRCQDSAASQANETMSFTDFTSEIEQPVAAYLAAHPYINYIVVTKGIPIRVNGGPTGEAYSGSANASLDSTLAALGYGSFPGAQMVQFNDPGGVAVGYAWKNNYWNANKPFSHAVYGGYLVTRLDGYSQSDAQALATRALASEAAGAVQGTVLLDADANQGVADPTTQPFPIATPLIAIESPYSTWNGDMARAAGLLQAAGLPVQYDLTTTFAGNESNLGGYFSFGSNDTDFNQAAYNSLFFAPGAVGDTAVSTSARSFFPQTSGQSMIADLVAQGITGVKGYTDEPLLQAISSPAIVLNRYTHGWTLADSFYAGSHFVGWTDIALGDPLTHPYPARANRFTPVDGPYGGVAYPVPGLIEAGEYDTGAQGIGYFVRARNGTADSVRPDGVDLEKTADIGGGTDLSWMAPGQWFHYTVNSPAAGPYSVTLRVASINGVADGFTLSDATGGGSSGPVAVPGTGGPQKWISVTATIGLLQGQQTLKLAEDSAGWKFHNATFAYGAPYTGTPAIIPGTVQAANYDKGGENGGYRFASPIAAGTSYRRDAADLEASQDAGTGYNLGWTARGQWTSYTVQVAATGTYHVALRVSAPGAVAGALHIADAAGNNLSGPVDAPATGDFQSWQTVTTKVKLPPGRQVLFLKQDAAGWNINSLTFAAGNSDQ